MLSSEKLVLRFAQDDMSFVQDDMSFVQDDMSFAQDDKGDTGGRPAP